MPEWKSQARQDEFVHLVLPRSTGTFLDIGSHDPIHINNTYALERLGWTGSLFDCDPKWRAPTEAARTSPFYCEDVTTFDWATFFGPAGTTIDYLSFDVDEASLKTLRRFPFDLVTFNVCTIEHDRYRFGAEVAEEMRSILTQHGYVMLCEDVRNDGLPYEDWYVRPELAPAGPLPLCTRLEWTDTLKTLRTHYPTPSSEPQADA
jgi:hypothetical protein